MYLRKSFKEMMVVLKEKPSTNQLRVFTTMDSTSRVLDGIDKRRG
jgi:hypothetical protein